MNNITQWKFDKPSQICDGILWDWPPSRAGIVQSEILSANSAHTSEAKPTLMKNKAKHITTFQIMSYISDANTLVLTQFQFTIVYEDALEGKLDHKVKTRRQLQQQTQTEISHDLNTASVSHYYLHFWF